MQPWPGPMKAKMSYSNFSLAWISSILILIGIFQVTLGGIGLSGFFTLRNLYFLSGNTFEALVKIGTGLLLLNLTIRRVDLKNVILIVSAGFQAIILFSRNINSINQTQELTNLINHFDQIMKEVDFYDQENPRQLLTRVKRFFRRSGIDRMESNIFRGLFSAIQKKLKQ